MEVFFDLLRYSGSLRPIFYSATAPDNRKIIICDSIYPARNERSCPDEFCGLMELTTVRGVRNDL